MKDVAVDAVLFDFSGTLFRLEEDESWLTEITDGQGETLDLAGQAELLRKMTAPTGLVAELDPEYHHAWENRDLDPALHRKVYLEVLRHSGVTVTGQAEGLYGRLIDPYSWTPYPDTVEVITKLHAAGVKVGVISNIAFDIRPAFERLGILSLIDEVLLSYVEGVIKPEAELFARACQRLDVAAANALMVGDSEEADGGAASIGCRVEIVEPSPTHQRPDALLSAVENHYAGFRSAAKGS